RNRVRTLYLFFTATAPSAIYTLSLHDALPISARSAAAGLAGPHCRLPGRRQQAMNRRSAIVLVTTSFPISGDGSEAAGSFVSDLDRKSTRLNSSHVKISYAVFCLKKKKSTRCE